MKEPKSKKEFKKFFRIGHTSMSCTIQVYGKKKGENLCKRRGITFVLKKEDDDIVNESDRSK